MPVPVHDSNASASSSANFKCHCQLLNKLLNKQARKKKKSNLPHLPHHLSSYQPKQSLRMGTTDFPTVMLASQNEWPNKRKNTHIYIYIFFCTSPLTDQHFLSFFFRFFFLFFSPSSSFIFFWAFRTKQA